MLDKQSSGRFMLVMRTNGRMLNYALYRTGLDKVASLWPPCSAPERVR
jgi:hypothetical protein